jgi:acetolactate synthase-1/3 small subunit
MDLIKEFTLSVFTENQIGMLNRVTIIFTRRKLNIESITASKTEQEGIYRYTIVVKTSEEMIKKVVSQLEKQVEILKALYYLEHEVVYQEIALYKIAMPDNPADLNIESLTRQNNARILHLDKDYVVIEKTGKRSETHDLYLKLEPFGVLEFARSGRVAITKPMKQLNSFLKEMEEANDYNKTYINTNN